MAVNVLKKVFKYQILRHPSSVGRFIACGRTDTKAGGQTGSQTDMIRK